MKTKILILLVTTTLFLGCFEEKDPTIPRELPPATQEGKNTAGCYINDELFVLSGNSGLQQTNPWVEYTDYLFEGYKKISIGLQDFNFSRKVIQINIYIKDDAILDTKIPLLYGLKKIVSKKKENIDSVVTGVFLEFMDSNGNDDVFETFEQQNSFIQFTNIDKENKILSGFFSFEVKHRLSNGVLKITEGRFDLKMKYYQ